jgi:hypothetical protein
MQFQMPRTKENMVCQKCQHITKLRFDACDSPCSHLVAWTHSEANTAINKEFVRMGKFIDIIDGG